ncbi:MAG TPA: S8 family serine peptidase [Solirubrobacterales bacterium]
MSGGLRDMTRAKRRAGARALIAPLAGFLALVAASVALGAGQAGDDLGRYIVVLKDSIDHPGAVARAQTEGNGGKVGFVYRRGPVGYSAALSDNAVRALARNPVVRDIRPDRQDADVQMAQAYSTGIKRVFAFGNKALQIDEKNNFQVNADVAVIDGGFSISESDLNVLKRTYCNGSEEFATCKDGEGNDVASGHGTRMASAIGALDNSEGVVGVAPGVRLWSVKVFDPSVFESEIVAGLEWVTQHANQIEVANMSLGCTSLPCERSTAREAMTAAVEAGVVVVVAAGNNGENAEGSDYASHPQALAVSGIADYDGAPGFKATAWWYPSCNPVQQPGDTEKRGADDALYTKSNFGAVVDVTAPAVCIRTLMPGGTLAYSTGTSVATAEVSGAAAIVAFHVDPENSGDVEEIRKTITKAGNLEWEDTSKDGVAEPLEDLSNEETFK